MPVWKIRPWTEVPSKDRSKEWERQRGFLRERGGGIKGSKGDWWNTNGSVAACCEDPIKNNKGSSRQSVHTPLCGSMMYLSDNPALPNEGTSDRSLTGQGARQTRFGGGILAFWAFVSCRQPSLLLSDVILCHPQESVFPFLLQMLIKCSGQWLSSYDQVWFKVLIEILTLSQSPYRFCPNLFPQIIQAKCQSGCTMTPIKIVPPSSLLQSL